VETKVVVAIRYLQIEGVSHAHLFLFQRDGTLVRQLTQENSGQAHDPVFSPNGAEIVYQRGNGKKEEWRAVSPSGKNDHLLDKAPAWYQERSVAPPQFGFPESVRVADGSERTSTAAKAGEIRFALPGGSLELILKDDGKLKSSGDPCEFPKKAWLHEAGKEADVCVEDFPVFSPKRAGNDKEFWAGPLPGGIVANEERKDAEVRPEGLVAETVLLSGGSPFLESPPLQAVFFSQHRGSTDGVGQFALDLHSNRLFELTPNGGPIYALPGLSEFACVCGQRYLPLGDGMRTVDCSYFDLWDAKMQRTRFAAARPAVFLARLFKCEARSRFRSAFRKTDKLAATASPERRTCRVHAFEAASHSAIRRSITNGPHGSSAAMKTFAQRLTGHFATSRVRKSATQRMTKRTPCTHPVTRTACGM
jgi:hypothetical protein